MQRRDTFLLSWKMLSLNFFIISVTSVVASEIANGSPENRKKIEHECNMKFNVSDEAMEKLTMDSTAEEIPKGMFCIAKCIDENLGVIKDGKISIEKMNELDTTTDEGNHEEYLKCLSKVDASKPCENYTGPFECRKLYKDEGKMKRDCNKKYIKSSEKFMKVNKYANVEEIPKKLLCSAHCLDEKLGIIVDGKLNMSKLRNRKKLLTAMTDPEEYLKCLKNIDNLKSCENYNETYLCGRKFNGKYVENCLHEGNLTIDAWKEFNTEYRTSNRNETKILQFACVHFCILNKKGLLKKDGTLDLNLTKETTLMFHGRKNQEKLWKCLQELKITKCEDYKKIWNCQEEI